MKCSICGTKTISIFTGQVLSKYQVEYFKCPNCDFIQTEKPYWLDEAYGNAITDLDVGLVSRNLSYADMTATIINKNFQRTGKFLDYAGGYGLFVRLMRDKGFNFYREDKYCENLFAVNFDLQDIGGKKKFELATAFELFEHLDKPLEDIEKIFSFTDTIIFSTELQPKTKIKAASDWWYFTPETGQHISFYSRKTLEYIAKKYHLSFYSSDSLHILSRRKFTKNPLSTAKKEGIKGGNEPKSLMQSDFEIAKNVIKSSIPSETHGKTMKIGNTGKPESQKSLADKLVLAYCLVEEKEKELNATRTELEQLKTNLFDATEKLNSLIPELDSNRSRLERVSGELAWIYSSRTWRVAQLLQRIVKISFPTGSLRRRLASFIFKPVKKAVRFILNLKSKMSECFLQGEILRGRLKSKRKRDINRKSKKIVYIGHSYHNKTKSTEFLIDYLKKFYDVTLILDESWRGEGDKYPDLSFIDESYLGVIFFQNLPGREIVSAVKNDNIIYFPMYDAASGLGYDFWRNWRDLKIMNFSSTLHKKLSKWGFESDYVQYFPEQTEFAQGNKNEVFFWQRLTKISINEIAKLFGNEKVKIHIHKAIDPVQQFVQPTEAMEKQYQITYSEWFKTRDGMLETIKQKAIYVAPREFEGIGMSFLEAMALGKAVIAVNNPTMNEYIVNNKTGYLFDLSNPKRIDLSNIDRIQKNTYEYMCNGYEKWEVDKHRIIDFIER